MPVSPSASGTVTGQVGPAMLSGSIPFQNVRTVLLDFDHDIGQIVWVTSQGETKRIEWDLSLTTTLTDVITSFAHVFTISGT